MWWLYFDFIARRPTRPSFSIALVWVYLHIAAMASIVIVGAAIAAGIAGDETLPAVVQVFLFAGLGATLISFGLLELTLDRTDDEPTHPRLSPGLKFLVGVILIAIAVAQPTLNTIVAFSIAIAALAIQAAYGAVVYFKRG